MNTIIMVPLEKTADSPYQVGLVDAAVVAEIAESLKTHRENGTKGLIQVPLARVRDGVYELAVGRHRRAAFAKNAAEGDAFFEEMPLMVRELSDEEMFDALMLENWKRRDITLLERAELIDAWMREFGKNSTEAAEKFGHPATTIRGWLRLLNLPEPAKEKVRTGEIKTGEARSLLVVDKLLGEAGVQDVLNAMEEEGDGAIEAIQDALRYSDEAKELDHDDEWVTADPFPRKHWRAVTRKEIERLLIAEDEAELEGKAADVERLVSFAQGGMEITEEAFGMFAPEGLEKVRTVVNPPGCLTCPLHAQLDGTHYCALRTCAARKAAAWSHETAERVSRETGIPLYEKGRDGAFSKLNLYNDDSVKLFKARHADLRVMATDQEVYANRQVDLSTNVQVVLVGKALEKLKKKDEKKAESQPEKKEIPWKAKRKIWQALDEIKDRFLWEVVAPVFAAGLGGLTSVGVLRSLADAMNPSLPSNMDYDDLVKKAAKSKKDGAATLRRLIVLDVVEFGISSEKKNPIALGVKEADLVGLAKAWGVKLPRDWEAQVKTYDEMCMAAKAEIVKPYKGKG